MIVNFMDPEKLETLEQYATMVLLSMRSMLALNRWQTSSLTRGILNEEEEQRVSLIVHDIARLVRLYDDQLTDVLERTNIKKEELINQINSLKP